jgi:hypothetical protein
MSDYDSEGEEAMAIPRDYGDYEESGDSSDSNYSYPDADATEENYKHTDDYFADLIAMKSNADYRPAGKPIVHGEGLQLS